MSQFEPVKCPKPRHTERKTVRPLAHHGFVCYSSFYFAEILCWTSPDTEPDRSSLTEGRHEQNVLYICSLLTTVYTLLNC